LEKRLRESLKGVLALLFIIPSFQFIIYVVGLGVGIIVGVFLSLAAVFPGPALEGFKTADYWKSLFSGFISGVFWLLPKDVHWALQFIGIEEKNTAIPLVALAFAFGFYTVFWLYRVAKYGETKIFFTLLGVTILFLYLAAYPLAFVPETTTVQPLSTGSISGGLLFGCILFFDALGTRVFKKRSWNAKIMGPGFERPRWRKKKGGQAVSEVPQPSNPLLTTGEFLYELQKTDQDLELMKRRGEPAPVLLKYLWSVRARIRTRIETSELKTLEDYFQQREKTIRAAMGAYEAEASLKDLHERTKLQRATDMAKVKADHERALQDQQSAAEQSKLSSELKITQLKTELAAAKRQQKSSEDLSEIQAKIDRLEAQKRLDALEHPPAPAPKAPRESPEERLVRRLANLKRLEKQLEEDGIPEPDRQRIIEEARRSILVENRLGNQP